MALIAAGAAMMLTSSGMYYYFSGTEPVKHPTTTKEITNLKIKNKLPNQELLKELKDHKLKLKPVSVEKSLKNSTYRLEKLITELRDQVKLEK